MTVSAPVTRRAAALLVGEVMTTRLVTVTPNDSLLAAWELLRRGNFRHLPVVGPDARCLAVVDDRLLAGQWLVSSLTQPRQCVGDVMPARVHCVPRDATLGRVAEIMAVERVTAVPVVDEYLRLVGLVTDRDIVREVAGEMSGA